MICKCCGEEFDKESFSFCPFCLTDWKEEEKIPVEVSAADEVIAEPAVRAEQVVVEEVQEETELLAVKQEKEPVGVEEFKENNPDMLPIDNIAEFSTRSRNGLLRNNITTIKALKAFLKDHSILEIKGLGKDSADNIEAVYNKILKGEELTKVLEEVDNTETVVFVNINPCVKELPLSVLKMIGFSAHFVNIVSRAHSKIGELETSEAKLLTKACLPVDSSQLLDLANLLQMDVRNIMEYILASMKGTREMDAFIFREQGFTLEEIGKSMGVTRERVRQMEASFFKKLHELAEIVLEHLKPEKNIITLDELLEVYDDDEYDYCMTRLAKLSKRYEYLPFADIFVKRDRFALESVADKALKIVVEEIGDSGNLNDIYPAVEINLEEYGIDFLDMEDIKRLLQKNGYRLFGDFALKGGKSYALLYADVIRREFPNGIHTNQDNDNPEPDLIRLRQLVQDKYPTVHSVDRDRTLTARLSDCLIECDRGMLTAKENVYFEGSVLEDIIQYIEESGDSQIYFSNIFKRFVGVLQATSNITNRYFLHGVMTWLYPDSYIYNRDYLVKKSGKHNRKLTDRLVEYLQGHDGIVSRNEFKAAFPELSDIMLSIRVYEDDRIMPWKFNWYALTSIIKCSAEEKNIIKQQIEELMTANYGYCSSYMIYERIKKELPNFLTNSRIDGPASLAYALAYLFKCEYDFMEGNIGRKERFAELTAAGVIKTIFEEENSFSFGEYIRLVRGFGWPDATQYIVWSRVEKEYFRLGVDHYVKKENFSISENDLAEIESCLDKAKLHGVVPLASVTDFKEMPEIGYSWNQFLLQSIIETLGKRYRIVGQKYKDRRYIRSVAVPTDSEFQSYDQIVANYLKEEQITQISEGNLLQLLNWGGLAGKVIPLELKNSELFNYKDGMFSVLVS